MAKKQSPLLFFIIALGLILSPFIGSVSAAPIPRVVVTPSTLAPDSNFTAQASGFTPNSTITVLLNGQTFGVDLYFNEIKRITDGAGSALFTGHVPPTDTGVISFDFTDAKGVTAKGTYTVQGGAAQKFLFGPSVAVTDANIQIGITGVGWKKDAKKSVRGFTADDQPYTPEFIDLCAEAPCPERPDALKLALILPKSTAPGIHSIRVSEEGSPDEKEAKVEIPLTDENKDKQERTATIFLVDPPSATADIPSIAVRGNEWGPYDERRFVKAWLIDPDTGTTYDLTVDRNYRDCSFVNTDSSIRGACKGEADELFLRLEIPDAVKFFLQPKTYAIYVRTEKNIHGAVPFTLLGKPSFEKTDKPQLAIVPTEGPYGTYAVLFGTGFTRGEFLSVRFDGIKISVGGALYPNPDGTFDNVGLRIPASQTKTDGKIISVAPGKHTIEVSNDNGQKPVRALVTFTIIDKAQTDADKKKQELEEQKKREETLKKEEQLKKEKEQADKEQARIEKERIELEKLVKQKQEEELKAKKESEKERLEKEEDALKKKLEDAKKLEGQKEKKVEDVKKKQEDLADTFCDPTLPITFQPGCIQKAKPVTKSKYEGLPCDADLPITFQPGCVAQKPLEQMSPFKGKECSTALPVTFQSGCVPPTPSSASIQYAVPDSAGKPCSSDFPIVFQPGCVSRTPIAPQKPYAGRTCDSNLPLVWQEGCIQQQKPAEISPYLGKPCSTDMAITFQPGCVSASTQTQQKQTTSSASSVPQSTPAKKCDQTVPHYSQIGCVE